MPQIINPYKNVNWENQYKGNLHSHTMRHKLQSDGSVVRWIDEGYESAEGTIYGSDGWLRPEQNIDSYHSKGYKILAITDHDYTINNDGKTTTFPWDKWGRKAEELGMLAVEGKELSNDHHLLSLFNDLGEWTQTGEGAISNAISEIENRSGLAVFGHPGRHHGTNPYGTPSNLPLSWYIDLFYTHKDTLIGMEAFNRGNLFPDDIKWWDKVNAVIMHNGQCAYGFSNDDMHILEDLYGNYNIFLMEDLTEESLKKSMKNGEFYFSWEYGKSGDDKAPKITNITVDESLKIISIDIDSGTVTWITEGTTTVATGTSFNYSNFDKVFIRAQIENEFGITCTQPFGFISPRDFVPIKFIGDINFSETKFLSALKFTDIKFV